MIRENPDKERVKEIREALKLSDGYCPCVIEQSKDTKCMCKEFRDQLKDDSFYGLCHCGLYEKVKD